MLISTLISLFVIISLTMVLQSAALRNTMVMKRLITAQQDALITDSVRELARPLLAEAMLDITDNPALTLDGSPTTFMFDGQEVTLVAQDIDGLVDVHKTPTSVAEQLLPAEMFRVLLLMREGSDSGLSLRERFVRAGGDLEELPDLEMWLTDQARGMRVTGGHVSVRYGVVELPSGAVDGKQAEVVGVRVN